MAATRALLAAPLLLWATALALPLASGSWSEATTFCHTAARGGGGGGRVLSFLWRRPDGTAPVLVQSAWDARGRLLACALRDEPAHTRWYLGACEQRRALRVSGPGLRRALSALEAQRDACAGAEPSGEAAAAAPRVRRAPPAQAPQTREAKRVRRGWTMPGTVWCGAGDSAGNFSHLGVFKGPDVCCREHDQCSILITALAYKYGLRNLRLHTISHCDCDARFRDCLVSLNNTMANLVGSAYFDVLQIPCFELKEGEDCAEWNWWGMCTKYAPMPVAHLVEASPYEAISPSTPAPRPETQSAQGRKHNQKKQKQLGHAHLDRAEQRRPLAASRSCRCYQRLDQCPYKIGPHEVKYQLHNMDSRTLFHCNCTRRLARFLRRTRGPNEVEGEVLSDYVSASCFVLQAPPGCMEGEEEQPNCIDIGRAVLGRGRHLTNRLMRMAVGTSSKVKRQDQAPPGRPIQLFDTCMQLKKATLRTEPRAASLHVETGVMKPQKRSQPSPAWDRLRKEGFARGS